MRTSTLIPDRFSKASQAKPNTIEDLLALEMKSYDNNSNGVRPRSYRSEVTT